MHLLLLLVVRINWILLILRSFILVLFLALSDLSFFMQFCLHLRIIQLLIVRAILAVLTAAFLLLPFVHEFL